MGSFLSHSLHMHVPKLHLLPSTSVEYSDSRFWLLFAHEQNSLKIRLSSLQYSQIVSECFLKEFIGA
jgi:hypothetical protein